MRKSIFPLIAIGFLMSGCAAAPSTQRVDMTTLTKQVGDAERGFAKTMADRNFAAFQSFLSDEAVFFSGANPLRGKAVVAENWKKFYEKPDAPFSWEPEIVQVVDSGTLALTTGPVKDPSGKHFANFQSIWRQESPGVWKIVFDKGERTCDCAK